MGDLQGGVILGQRHPLSGGGRDVDEGEGGADGNPWLKQLVKCNWPLGAGVGIPRAGAFCWDPQSSPVNPKGNQP